MSKKQKYNSANRIGKKRGSYKKNKQNEVTKENTVDTFEVNNSDTSNVPLDNSSSINGISNGGVNENITETKQQTFEANGDEKYNDFLKEYGTPVSNESDLIDETTNDQKQEYKNKEYDFTANGQQQNQNLETVKQSNAMLVNGYMLLALCDFLIPNGILFLYKYVDERAAKVDASKTKLDTDQKAALMEAANAAAQYIFNAVNPLVIFFVGMGVFYASNIQSEMSKIPKIVKPKKQK